MPTGSVSEAIAIKTDPQNARLQYMVTESYIDADYACSHEAYMVNLLFESMLDYIQYDADEWLFEFDMVATGNTDVIGSLEVHQGAVCSPDTPKGIVDVPVVTDTENPLESCLTFSDVDVSTIFEFSDVTVNEDITVPVVFYANGGTFDDGSEEQAWDIPYNGGVFEPDISIPRKDGYIFEDWFDESGENVILNLSRSGMEVYARWVRGDFNLILDANGGEFYDGNTNSVEYTIPYGKSIYDFINEPYPTKIGYNFAGWILKAEKYTAIFQAVCLQTTFI